MLNIILSLLAILLSLTTSTGILLHDTKVDKAAILALSRVPITPYVTQESTIKLESTVHPHVERTSLSRAMTELRAQNPRVAPDKEGKKYRLQKKVGKGIQVSDGYYLPLALVNNGQFGF